MSNVILDTLAIISMSVAGFGLVVSIVTGTVMLWREFGYWTGPTILWVGAVLMIVVAIAEKLRWEYA